MLRTDDPATRGGEAAPHLSIEPLIGTTMDIVAIALGVLTFLALLLAIEGLDRV